MTETEAKNKWCPMVRFPGDDWVDRLSDEDLKAVSHGDIARAHRCIGSRCMMWRWLKSADNYSELDNYSEFPEGGYCGLGGK